MKKGNIFILLFLFIFIGCSNSTYKQTYSTFDDGKYDNGFPTEDCSRQLEEILKSVKKINCYVEYDIYRFSFSDNLTPKNLKSNSKLENYHADSSIVEAGFGTATLIYSDYQHQVLLTCAHVLDYKDTVYTYFAEVNSKDNKVFAEIAIKQKQQFFLKDGNTISHFQILEMDKSNDIALLSRKVDESSKRLVDNINYPIGKSSELQWGDFVYILGYPSGVQMVTRGIVSKSESNRNVFLIDALFNKGFSGGIVLALRDGIPNFEIVGMIQSASATSKNILVPSKKSHENIYAVNEEYLGAVYAEKDKRITYGITYATSIDAIVDFYKSRRNELSNLDYDLDSFFKD